MPAEHLQELIRELRTRIEDEHDQFYEEYGKQQIFSEIDDFLTSENRSDLEKAFFLILNQFPGDSKDYIIRPSEMVLIPDIYDLSCPGIEYEIDFALYGGSIYDPVKVAIECDGIRSHQEKHKNKDRRKDVNLQAAGWIVMRFGSKEIHAELQKFRENELYTSDFLSSIENTIQQKLKLINYRSYGNAENRSKLTGYRWDDVTCANCGKTQIDTLNHKTIKCRHCNTKFKRVIKPEEKIKYDFNGLLYFEE
jgi:DNA-directed RNA polymerase subunit RPC12/RpoP